MESSLATSQTGEKCVVWGLLGPEVNLCHLCHRFVNLCRPWHTLTKCVKDSNHKSKTKSRAKYCPKCRQSIPTFVVRTHCLIVRALHSWYPSVVDVRARIESVLGSAVFYGCALVKVATNEKRVAARRTKKCRAMTRFCYFNYSGKQGYHFFFHDGDST